MIKNHSFCLRKLRFIAVFLLFYPISLLSIQASEKSDMSNVVSNTAQQTSGILSVKKVNPTTVDVLFSNNQRRTIDFYGENIFRVFQDNSGGIIRDPEAKPEAQILVDQPRRQVSNLAIDEKDGIITLATGKVRVELNKQTGLMKVINLGTNACVIDEINKTRNAHVITLEDPIEYLHRHKKSVVTQREIGTDTESYVSGLRASLRQAPDVILLGEMRDFETIKTAMTAAETGHLVISTLHTVGAANTIDRIIDSFPPDQQQQIRIQISMVMQAVISQQLIPTTDGKEIPAFEIMFLNNAIRNMIREAKIHQIDSVISTAQEEGMITMDASLIQLYKNGRISRENAVIYSSNSELMGKKLNRI